jgi:acyl-CoA thioester hydrolase
MPTSIVKTTTVTADFIYRRRVQFAETDMAGIVHFSMYFRYMEEAEHALWRSVGLQIAPPDGRVGFPRVAATCDFKAPLRFEDEFEVHVRVEAVGRRSLKYGFTLRRGDEILATGSMTSVSVERVPEGGVRSVELPTDVVTRLR